MNETGKVIVNDNIEHMTNGIANNTKYNGFMIKNPFYKINFMIILFSFLIQETSYINFNSFLIKLAPFIYLTIYIY